MSEVDLNTIQDNLSELESIIDPEDSLSQSKFTLVEAAKKQVKELVATCEELEETTADEDFQFAKRNLRSLIAQANDGLIELIAIAKSSQHPGAYEVLTMYIRTLADINKDLMDLHSKKMKLSGPSVSQDKELPSGNYQQNNIIFTGSPTDLLDAINKAKGI